jgi:hypothetical protein
MSLPSDRHAYEQDSRCDGNKNKICWWFSSENAVTAETYPSSIVIATLATQWD